MAAFSSHDSVRNPRHITLRESDLQISIGPAPNQRQARHPIFPVDRFARVSMFFRRQNPGQRCVFRPGHFSPDGARGDAHLRVVANTLCLPHVAARHDVELVAIFSEPHRRSNRFAALAKSGEGDIFLAPNGGWDFPGHGNILTLTTSLREQALGYSSWLARLVRPDASVFDPGISSVLKALHA
jgi:hypothetical protein